MRICDWFVLSKDSYLPIFLLKLPVSSAVPEWTLRRLCVEVTAAICFDASCACMTDTCNYPVAHDSCFDRLAQLARHKPELVIVSDMHLSLFI